MTSGKASRKAKQNPTPPKRTPTSGARRQASPKVLMAGGAVVAAAILAIVLGVVLSGGSSSSLGDLPAVGSLENTNLSGAPEIDALFKGIPQSGLILGKADAPVTLTQFVDLQCPACRAYETTAFVDIVEKWVKPGKVRVDTQAWAFIGEDSIRGREAVLAAGKQNRAYNYMALLYANQGAENAGWLDDEMVGKVAAAIPGMQVKQLLDERSSQDVEDLGAAVDAKATADGVNSTPTIFVGKTGEKGTKVELTSLDDAAPVDAAIEKVLGDS